jgi:hypothetical protein
MSEHRLEAPIEGPEDDVAEQDALVDPDEEGDPAEPREGSLEVDPADRADQERTVSLDDDEYR